MRLLLSQDLLSETLRAVPITLIIPGFSELFISIMILFIYLGLALFAF